MRIILAAIIYLLAMPSAPRAADLTVFAAASLGDALGDIAQDWRAQTGGNVVISAAGTSLLARQIANGAPADIFVAASVDWMDTLVDSGDIMADTRRDLLGNQLVLIGHGPAGPALAFGPDLDLAGQLGAGRLALALVDAVPAGIYARAALEHLGLWDQIADQIAQTDHARAALTLVARGEAPFGIVYASDARANDQVYVAANVPQGAHPPIIYPAAILQGSRHPDAAAFLDYLHSPAARAIWQDAGFVVLP